MFKGALHRPGVHHMPRSLGSGLSSAEPKRLHARSAPGAAPGGGRGGRAGHARAALVNKGKPKCEPKKVLARSRPDAAPGGGRGGRAGHARARGGADAAELRPEPQPGRA